MADSLKQLFEAAVERDPAARASFVATACAGDRKLRDRLEALLRAHDEVGDFLEHPTSLVEAAAIEVAAAGDDLLPGQTVGRYTLVGRLGRGGFGSVWRAHQTEPVARDVALKVLHAGLDTGRVMARFLAERQTLARMQHPSIAKVFDAGATPAGRPWLAMELVDGLPITEHCNGRRLGHRERLSLFVDVCIAVQHAHSKGVVHRDLKPSNVLVAEREGRAEPVVIDFGVARALDEESGEGTLTGDGAQLLGTPDYMSPEQASFDRSEVDTRTDVYSLGVVLYELVSGTRPFARPSGLASQQELLRCIREDEPPPPSRCEGRLPGLPREVDWIVARAMAKQPAQRYPTAVALADDVQRLLRDEPVLAGPPSAAYRFAKLARRHRVAVVAATGMALSLGIGTFVAVHGWLQARAAEQVARQEQVAAERESNKANRALDLLDDLWEAANPARFGRPDYPVRELFGDFERALPARVADEPGVELRLRLTLGRLQRILGMLSGAAVHSGRAVELARATGDDDRLVQALLEQARTAFDRGEIDVAEAAAREALAHCGGESGTHPRAADGLETLANCAMRRNDREGALAFAERALAMRHAAGDPGAIARSSLQLASLHGSTGRADLAMTFLEAALRDLAPLGEDHPDAIVALQHLAYLQQRQGDFVAAETGFRDSLARRRHLYGDDHPHVAWAEADLAWLLHEQGRDRDAALLLRHAVPALRQRLGEQHLYVSEAMQRLGAVLVGTGELEEAAQLLAEAVQRYRALPGHPADGLVGCLGNLASLQWHRGEREAARVTQADALVKARAELPPDHFVVSVSMTNLAKMQAELGDPGSAAVLLREALALSTAAGRQGESRIQRERLAAVLEQLGRADEASAVRDAGK